MTYKFLLDLALILLSTKLLGLLTRKVNMPQVVGALLAGLILGPACFGVLQETEFITQLSEIGVIVLMFTAGLETNIKELKNCGVASTVVAVIGVIVPLIGGALLGHFSSVGGENLMQNIFIGVVLTATSVSITVETLKELGKLNTKVANTILGAAIIDDVLGIVVLTIVSSLAGESANVGLILLKIFLFFIFSGVVGLIFFKLFSMWFNNSQKDLRRYVIVAFVFCLLLSFVAEEWFGVADITGAFVAGLILSGTKRSHYITARFETVSYLFLSPIFFASVGIAAKMDTMGVALIVFSVLLVVIAVLSKIVGCYLGARMTGFNNKESIQIGAGMVSRGEVALIVANKGKALGLVSDVLFGPIIIMVVLTTIIAPILLKIAFRDKHHQQDPQDNPPAEPNPYEGKLIDPYDGSLID
ncbi:cation:proton antiporter [Massiliimalia massiliensis]|uniref:cation:proton antiporter n=1 Tax=Massiliimalia massiliensis TaxID=1852384 RepID=UPI00098688C0|nr:cation:proton antiporter [Massiliimalia massiliensis]